MSVPNNTNSTNPFAVIGNPVSGTDSEMSAKEAYFASLREWANQAYIAQNTANEAYLAYLQEWIKQACIAQNSMPLCPLCVRAINAQVIRAPIPRPAAFRHVPPTRTVRINNRMRAPVLTAVGGYEYVAASMLKRMMAQIIDLFILLMTKIIVLILLLNFFQVGFGRKEMQLALEEEFTFDYTKFTSDLLIIDLICALATIFYDAGFTAATPGKYFMKIRIYHVKTVMYPQAGYNPDLDFGEREPVRVLIFPAETPSLFRSLLRAFFKQLLFRCCLERMLMILVLPFSAVVMFYNFNRCMHDIGTSTIVVEKKLHRFYRIQLPRRR